VPTAPVPTATVPAATVPAATGNGSAGIPPELVPGIRPGTGGARPSGAG
jgi:hypothetical protein